MAALTLSLSACGAKENLVGVWHCKTTNPDQTISDDQFTFKSDGSFSLGSGNQAMLGSYEVQDRKVAMMVTEMPGLAAYGVSTDAHKPITAEITDISSTRLVMETYTTSRAVRRSSVCGH